jgi:alpha-tubulin suppressor-like RCC1 family protein
VSAGTNHTCGVTTGNVAYCWGLNDFGQLGDGTRDARLAPAAVGAPPSP